MNDYRNRLDSVVERIEQARLSVSQHHIVKIVAVSKYHSKEEVEALYKVGQRAFAENKVQDLLNKTQELEALPLEWHFIGHLQSNKINKLLQTRPFLMQSLDSINLAQALQKRLEAQNSTLNCLLQVNSAHEAQKSGVAPQEALDIYQEIQERFDRITLKGLMSIAAHSEDTKLISKSFETTHKIYEKVQKNGATILSMGMSGDFELAIKHGSTMVRIGSALF